MKRILLIATGGTIAARETGQGLAPDMAPEQLLAGIQGLERYCTVETVQVLNIDSTNIQPEHWLLMADTVRQYYDRYDGFVITHGTDTMAYTAAALSYLIQNAEKPIVLTGSQRPMGAGGSDAQKNLGDSFRFCTWHGAAGIYLVFDGKAIVGTRARKTKTMSYSAFESINFPVAAYINGHHIVSHFADSHQPEKPVWFYDKLDPNVFLLKLIPGMEPDVLDYVGARYRAVVIEGYGMGGLPFADRRNFLDRTKALARQGKIVVLATQVMLEGSDLGVYEVGVRAMREGQLLQAYDMTVESVVTKLMWILAKTGEYDKVHKLFYSPINRDLYLPAQSDS